LFIVNKWNCVFVKGEAIRQNAEEISINKWNYVFIKNGGGNVETGLKKMFFEGEN
jgi:hypothetical protein